VNISVRDFKKDHLYFVPLGGSGEIGMNCNLYCYNGRWLMVDLGVTFAQLPGIEVVMPELKSFLPYVKDLEGLFLTHAHEDHFGAVAYLWNQIRCPVYATPFTAFLLRQKMAEQRVNFPITEVPLSGCAHIGLFEVQVISLTHSIPEPNGLFIKTPGGNIFHTGDWKIDPGPLVGSSTDEKALSRIGLEGLDVIVCDSTNVFEEGHSGSEEIVRESLVELVKKCRGHRVVISCFASNIARLSSCMVAAQESGRQAVLAGRSLKRFDEAARACGYFKSGASAGREGSQTVPAFLQEDQAQGLSAQETLIVATGSQGEVRAALFRLAKDQHPFLKLEAGDYVIFSSRIIPGNEKQIYALQNLLVRRGIHLITHKEADQIHVSGHPSQEELREMYTWTKPKKALPVHGEDRHLKAHVDFALSLGVKEALAPHNGDIIHIGPGPMEKVGHMFAGRLGVDGNRLIPLESPILQERVYGSEHGVIMVSVVLRKEQLYDCHITFWGLFDRPEAAQWAGRITKRVQQVYGQVGYNRSALESAIPREVRSIVFNTIRKKPLVFLHICE
jgi:ribonuclease J